MRDVDRQDDEDLALKQKLLFVLSKMAEVA
jgi:hypothetical protein